MLTSAAEQADPSSATGTARLIADCLQLEREEDRQVFEEMVSLIDQYGSLLPVSLDTVARRSNLRKESTAAALKRLQVAGLLHQIEAGRGRRPAKWTLGTSATVPAGSDSPTSPRPDGARERAADGARTTTGGGPDQWSGQTLGGVSGHHG